MPQKIEFDHGQIIKLPVNSLWSGEFNGEILYMGTRDEVIEFMLNKLGNKVIKLEERIVAFEEKVGRNQYSHP